MRIRITRTESGEIDGIDIGSLRAGLVYDLPASLATCLILNTTAEPVETRTTSSDEERIAVNVQTWREIAATGTPGRRQDLSRSSKHKLK